MTTKTKGSSPYNTAFKLLVAGFSVIPSGSGPDGKAPAVSWKPYQDAPADEAQLERWQEELNPNLWGIVTNASVAVIEADTPEALKKLTTALGQPPHTLSPRGGGHWYIDTTGHPLKTVAGLLPGIDARGVGGFINIVGKSKLGEYKNLDLPIPGDNLIPWAKLPKDILAALNGSKPKGTALQPGTLIPDGERNDRLTRLAGAMRRQGASQATIESALLKVECETPLPESEIKAIAASIGRYEPTPDSENHRHFNLSDYGNAERLASHFDGIIHYNPERKLWLVWNSKFWEWDLGNIKIARLAKKTDRLIYKEASDEPDEKLRTTIAKHALATEAQARLDAMITSSISEPGISILLPELDTDKMLLNVANGTIDLRTGTLKPHDKADLITKIVPIEYDPDAKCPMWMKFLNDTTDGNEDLINYLQLIFGVCLTGDMLDQVFFYIYGQGQNGKSTFTTMLLELVGDYGMRVDSNLFLEADSGKGATEALANIRGKRVIISSEVPEGKHLNTGLLKDLAGGGEALRARRLYEHEVEFKPSCKVLMFGNYKPTVKESTLALWRRLKLIPFTHTVSDADRDSFLGEKLRDELPGVLGWAVKGCLSWQAVRFLDEPDAITNATREYRTDEFLLADFLDDGCELGADKVIDQAGLKRVYHKWCEANSVKPLGPKKFATRLTERGCKKDRVKGVRSWVGVSLKEDAQL